MAANSDGFYQYGTGGYDGYGYLNQDQFNQFMSKAPQDAYTYARTLGLSPDDVASLWNNNNDVKVSGNILQDKFEQGTQNYAQQNNLGWITYDDGVGAGRMLPVGSNVLNGTVQAYDPNPEPYIPELGAPVFGGYSGPYKDPNSAGGLVDINGNPITGATPDAASTNAGSGTPRNVPPPVAPLAQQSTHPILSSQLDTAGPSLDSPSSGKNWRSTVVDSTGMSDEQLYNSLYEDALSGMSLSEMARKYNLNPGEIIAIYNRAIAYAQQTGKPIFQPGAVSTNSADYYNYGFGPSAGETRQPQYQREIYDPITGKMVKAVNPLAAFSHRIQWASKPENKDKPIPTAPPMVGKATGGKVAGGLGAIKQDPVAQRYIRGGRPTGGQEDDIPAVLSNNEYVMDADTVAALGDGNPDAGALKLDKMRENIRKHKRSASPKNIPPKAKAPEQYLKGK